MKPIPIAAATRIATSYGYDQVIIIGRKVGDAPAPCGEHVTTYGVSPEHCDAAARAGRALQRFMQWPLDPKADPVVAALEAAILALRSYQYGNASADLAASIADAGDDALLEVGLPAASPLIGETPAHG